MIVTFYIIFIIVGFLLAYLYGRKTKRFLWREYFAMIIAPLLGLGGLVFLYGRAPLLIFFIGMIVGPILEWLLGVSTTKHSALICGYMNVIHCQDGIPVS